jgi:hypothetical protein
MPTVGPASPADGELASTSNPARTGDGIWSALSHGWRQYIESRRFLTPSRVPPPKRTLSAWLHARKRTTGESKTLPAGLCGEGGDARAPSCTCAPPRTV